jgi:hypothetical protein
MSEAYVAVLVGLSKTRQITLGKLSEYFGERFVTV